MMINKLVILLFIFGYGLLLYTHPLFVNGDLGVNVLQPAHRIAEGQVPYRDFFAFYTPSSFYLLAGLFRILGETERTVRLLVTIQGMALLFSLYCIARKITGKKWLSLLPSLFIGGVVYPDSAGYLPHWLSGLWGLLAVLLLLPKEYHSRVRRWEPLPYETFLAGFLSGMSFLTMQSRGAWLFFGMIFVILIFSPFKKMRCAGWAILGFCCSLLIGAIVALQAGALDAVLKDTIVWPVTHYRRIAGYPCYYYPDFREIAANVSKLHSGFIQAIAYLWTDFVKVSIGFQFLVWIPLGVLAAFRAKGSERHILGSLLSMGIAFFFFGIYRPDALHMGQADLLGMTILLGAIKYLKGFPYKAKVTVLTIVATIACVGLMKEIVLFPSQPLYPIDRGIVRGGIEIADFRQFLEKNNPGNTKMAILNNSPHLYWLFSLENPISWDSMIPGYHSEEQVIRATRDLAQVCPEWIILD